MLARAEPTEPKKAEEPEGRAAKVELGDFGLEVQELTPELAKPFGFAADAKGVVISDVKEGSSAEAERPRAPACSSPRSSRTRSSPP